MRCYFVEDGRGKPDKPTVYVTIDLQHPRHSIYNSYLHLVNCMLNEFVNIAYIGWVWPWNTFMGDFFYGFFLVWTFHLAVVLVGVVESCGHRCLAKPHWFNSSCPGTRKVRLVGRLYGCCTHKTTRIYCFFINGPVPDHWNQAGEIVELY